MRPPTKGEVDCVISIKLLFKSSYSADGRNLLAWLYNVYKKYKRKKNAFYSRPKKKTNKILVSHIKVRARSLQ